MVPRFVLAALALAILLGLAPYPGSPVFAAATRRWTGLGADSKWSTAANWDIGAPSPGDSLLFSAGSGNLLNQNDYPDGTQFNNITIEGSGYLISGNRITLNGQLKMQAGGTDSTVALPIALQPIGLVIGNFNVGAGDTLIVLGQLSGSGAFTKLGPGELKLSGAPANTFTGSAAVFDGTLALNRTTGPAIPGDLIIGLSAGSKGSHAVRLDRPNQIASNAAITVNLTGLLDLNGNNQTVGPLTLVGGNISTGAGTLTLAGGVTGLAATGVSVVTGKVSLNGMNQTFSLGDSIVQPDVQVNADISDGGAAGSITKTGPGWLGLGGNNSYTGLTDIQAGAISVASASALGSPAAGTKVATGATLRIEGTVTIPSEPLSAAETNMPPGSPSYINLGSPNAAFNGPITIGGGDFFLALTPNASLSLGGPIGGTGRLIVGGGLVTLAGTNTFSGQFTANDGTAKLGAAGALPASVDVFLYPTAIVDLNGFDATIDSLDGHGTINLGARTLTIGANNGYSTFDGQINGTGKVVKTGTGDWNANSGVTYSGGTDIWNGFVKVKNPTGSGLGTGPVTVGTTGKIAGSGTVAGTVTVQAGGWLWVTAGGPVFTVGALTLDPNAVVVYTLSAPGSNNIVNVTGNLTFAGTFQIFDGSQFGANTYRLMNYGGTLTAGSTFVALKPAGYVLTFDTATPGQVNLISQLVEAPTPTVTSTPQPTNTPVPSQPGQPTNTPVPLTPANPSTVFAPGVNRNAPAE